jgi:hypothetical protein
VSGDARRSSDRARNVTRPDFGQKMPKPSPYPTEQAHSAPASQESAPERTGTDDWERF